MVRWLLGVLVVACPSVALAKPAQAPKSRVVEVAKEIRGEIADIHEALAEVTPQRSNGEEICFRVGSLYMTARHELEEVAESQKDLSAPAKQLIGELIKDGRSLPSFCDDKEKVKKDPGYEQVKKADVADLKRELANMDSTRQGAAVPLGEAVDDVTSAVVDCPRHAGARAPRERLRAAGRGPRSASRAA